MILVTGAAGQLGQALRGALAGREAMYRSSAELDITDAEACRKLVAEQGIKLILNAAAYTKVDKAESDEELAFKVNRDGAANLARAAAEVGAALVHVSTDYVFDGKARQEPYTEADSPNPQTVYGRSKLAGEQAVQEILPEAVILRTGWVYSAYGHNFLNTMLRLGAERDSLSVVDDQVGTPTLADSLARDMVTVADGLAKGKAGGLYHYAGLGQTTWCGFAREIMRSAGLACEVKAITTAEYPTPAARPAYSVLDTTAFRRHWEIELNQWQEELSSCLTARLR